MRIRWTMRELLYIQLRSIMSKNVRKNVVISPSICKSFKHIFYVDICTCDVHVIFTHFRFFERRPRHEKIIQNSCSCKYEGFCTNCVLLRFAGPIFRQNLMHFKHFYFTNSTSKRNFPNNDYTWNNLYK